MICRYVDILEDYFELYRDDFKYIYRDEFTLILPNIDFNVDILVFVSSL